MPFGLVPRVRTQDQGCPFQEVHHCDTHVMEAYREKNVRICTDLTSKLLNLKMISFGEFSCFLFFVLFQRIFGHSIGA